jgi:hypothetical protein
MIRLTPDELERRRRAKVGRILTGAAALVLMIFSAVLPNVMVQAAMILPGRSLIPASHFFLIANPTAEAFSGAKSVADAGLGIGVTYLGLAFQQIGLLTGLLSFWVLMVEDVGRWTRRLVLFSAVFLLLGASTVILGYQLLNSAGIPTLLGYAWLPTLLAGLIMIIGGRLAVSAWFLRGFGRSRKSSSPNDVRGDPQAYPQVWRNHKVVIPVGSP